MAVRFGLLGTTEADVDGVPVDLGHPKQRAVLAVLLVEANQVVSTEQLLGRVWGESPPLRGRETLYTYLSRLRTALAATTEVRLDRRSGGYLLSLDDQMVDLHLFHHLRAGARTMDDDQRAMEVLEGAMALWRGEPLPELDSPWAANLRTALATERLAAELDHADIALRCGRHHDLLPLLSARAERHPLDERIAGQFLLALYRSGRQADAMDTYQHIRTKLRDELGADPGPQLQRLYQQILTADRELIVPTNTAPPVPRHLPAPPRLFTGRTDELTALTNAIDIAAQDNAAVVISAVAGAGGIGKTWLALYWAHQNLDRFPDGQLFVDLRGFSPDGQPLSSAAAARGFLDALGVAPDQVPLDPHAQIARYRTEVAGRRMLIVLDNAANTDQVTTLLPGTPTCTVLVTSRQRLTGLVARHGAHHLPLDVLSGQEAFALLAARLGAARIAAEPEAAQELLTYCGGFPLALSIIAGRAHMQPRMPLKALAGELRDAGLSALDESDPAASLPTVLSWSYANLTEEQAMVFGLLGMAPGPDIALSAVANLANLSTSDAKRVLRALEEASLVDRDMRGRWRMHDLIRAYATSTARTLPDGTREDALRRVVDFYLHTAYSGERLLHPHRPPIELGAPVAGCQPHTLTNQAEALTWFRSEYPCLMAAQRLAGDRNWHDAVWQLAWATDTFHVRQGYLHDRFATWQAGLAAAEREGDTAVILRARRSLGRVCTRIGRHAEALDHLEHALKLAQDLGDLLAQVQTHGALTGAWAQQGNDRQALEHGASALKLSQTLDHPHGEAVMLNAVGWLHARLGDHQQARTHCEAALALFRANNNRQGEAATLETLGYLANRTGQESQALSYYQQALTHYRALGHTYNESDALDHLGQTHLALGQREETRAVWREAIDLYRQQGRDTDAERVQQQLNDLDNPL